MYSSFLPTITILSSERKQCCTILKDQNNETYILKSIPNTIYAKETDIVINDHSIKEEDLKNKFTVREFESRLFNILNNRNTISVIVYNPTIGSTKSTVCVDINGIFYIEHCINSLNQIKDLQSPSFLRCKDTTTPVSLLESSNKSTNSCCIDLVKSINELSSISDVANLDYIDNKKILTLMLSTYKNISTHRNYVPVTYAPITDINIFRNQLLEKLDKNRESSKLLSNMYNEDLDLKKRNMSFFACIFERKKQVIFLYSRFI